MSDRDSMEKLRAKRFDRSFDGCLSPIILCHQLRVSSQLMDADTKKETGWATTSDRAGRMREAADEIERLDAALADRTQPDAGEGDIERAAQVADYHQQLAQDNLIEGYQIAHNRGYREASRRIAFGIRALTASQGATRDGDATFRLGDRVEKISGSSWRGRVVGTYSTSLTPEGYAVESEHEPGSVQIYPAKALRALSAAKEVG